jgi:hypothetical protein
VKTLLSAWKIFFHFPKFWTRCVEGVLRSGAEPSFLTVRVMLRLKRHLVSQAKDRARIKQCSAVANDHLLSHDLLML